MYRETDFGKTVCAVLSFLFSVALYVAFRHTPRKLVL